MPIPPPCPRLQAVYVDYRSRLDHGIALAGNVTASLLSAETLCVERTTCKPLSQSGGQPACIESGVAVCNLTAAQQTRAESGKLALAVVNPLAWNRTDAVSLVLPPGLARTNAVTVVDAEGVAVPAQLSSTAAAGDCVNPQTPTSLRRHVDSVAPRESRVVEMNHASQSPHNGASRGLARRVNWRTPR